MEQTGAVIIAGGGIGGLCAALALARMGLPSIVLERAPALKEVGAGLQLGPNVFRAFDRLGVTAEVDRVVWRPDCQIMSDSVTGEEITRVALGETFVRRFGYRYAVAYRPDLLGVLADSCRARSALIEFRVGSAVAGFEESGERVVVRLEDGRLIAGRALIGADGLWSQVRQAILGDGRPRISGHIAYRAVIPVGDVPPDLLHDHIHLWAGPRNHLVSYKLRRGELFNLVAVFHSDRYVEGWDAVADKDELDARFAGVRPEVRRLLDLIETWRMWVLCDREPVRGWSRGRATLLGDAAHPMLQYLAQGACMAAEDAVSLADKLDLHGDDVAGAFRAYEMARYLRTARVQVTARYFGDFYHAEGVRRELRNQMVAGRNPENYDGNAWLYDGA
jgi:salicylate hydroxylase